jgi:hypothetical protein
MDVGEKRPAYFSTLLDVTCWPHLYIMLDDVGLSLSLLEIFIHHHAKLLASFKNKLYA